MKNIIKKKNAKKKIVALVCMSFHEMAGGIERQIIRTTIELRQLGFNTLLLSFDNEDAESFFDMPSDVKWIKCGFGLQPFGYASKIERIRQIYMLRKVIVRNQITDIITFHHGLYPRILLASCFLNLNNIVSERNSLANYKFIKLSKFNIGFLSLFFAKKITVQLEQYIKDYPRILQNKISVVPNFVKQPIRYYEKPNFNSLVVSMLGRLSYQKNFEPFLDQLNEISFKRKINLKVKIAGDGELMSVFKNKYSHLIDNGVLELLGKIKDVDDFLRNSSLFCFPSLWEGYPNALAEALRIGLPVVISKRLSTLNQFVEHNFNGLVVDDNEIFIKTENLINNKKLLNKMSKNSFLKYQNLYSNSPLENWDMILKN